MENSIKGDAGKTGKRSGLKRTSLYASASSPVNMIQAAFYEEDCLVYDLEDSVSAAEKDSARFLVCNALRYHRPKDKYVVVRVNGIYSEYIEEDLEAIVRARPDAIRIPKVEYGKEVKSIASRISEIEKKAGVISNPIWEFLTQGKSPWPIRGWKRWRWGLKISRPAWEL